MNKENLIDISAETNCGCGINHNEYTIDAFCIRYPKTMFSKYLNYICNDNNSENVKLIATSLYKKDYNYLLSNNYEQLLYSYNKLKPIFPQIELFKTQSYIRDFD